MTNPNHETHTVYDAAHVRLEAVTSDRDALEGFERLVKNHGDLDDAFLEAVCKRNISLDYLFLGKGTPFTGKADAA